MARTRFPIVVALACTACIVAACGIDAVGSLQASDVPDGSPSTTPPSGSSSGDPTNGSDGDVDAADDASDAASSADVLVDAAPDAPPLVPPYLILTHAPATGSIDLTTEGAKEWAYWGYKGNTNSTRNAGATNVISALFYAGTGFTTSQGFGATLAWSNGPTGEENGSGDWYRGADQSDTSGYMTVRAPSGPLKQLFTVVVGGNNVRGKMTASLSDGSVVAKVDNTYSNLTGSIAVKYTVEYATIGVAQVEMKWEPDVVAASGAQLRFTAAALR